MNRTQATAIALALEARLVEALDSARPGPQITALFARLRGDTWTAQERAFVLRTFVERVGDADLTRHAGVMWSVLYSRVMYWTHTNPGNRQGSLASLESVHPGLLDAMLLIALAAWGDHRWSWDGAIPAGPAIVGRTVAFSLGEDLTFDDLVEARA